MRNDLSTTKVLPVFSVVLLLLALPARAGVNQWTMGGPYGARVSALAVDGSGAIYAGTREGGVYRGENAGQDWVHLEGDFTKSSITALAHVGSDAVYAATDGDGVFKRTSGGTEWISVNSGIANLHIKSLSSDGSGAIYAGTNGEGIFKSTNGGGSWSAINSGLGNLQVHALACMNSQIIYAGTSGGGVFMSPNAGASWYAVNSGIKSLYVTQLAVDDAGQVYAGVYGSIYMSSNLGMTWSETTRLTYPFRHGTFAVSSSGTIYSFGISQTSLLVPAAGGAVFKSIDGGTTWRNCSGTISAIFNALAVDGTGAVYGGASPAFGSHQTGVFKSVNGESPYMPCNSGMGSPVSALAIGLSGEVYAVTAGTGIFQSGDGGATWNSTCSCSGIQGQQIKSLSVDSSGILYAGTHDIDYYGSVYRSANGGGNWALSRSNFIPYSLAVDPTEFNTVYAGEEHLVVAKTMDAGLTWAPTGLKHDGRTLAIDDSGVVYAGGYDGVWKSVDRGATWAPADTGLPGENITSLSVDPGNPETVYAGTWSGGIYRSANGGLSWQPSGLSGQGIGTVVVHPSSGAVYAGTWGQGVLKSTDGGESWTSWSEGLASRKVRVLGIDPTDPSRLYAGTAAGVYHHQDAPLPATSFTVEPLLPAVSQKVSFNSTSTGVIDDYFWDFGDGGTASGPNVTHSYAKAGTFAVNLTTRGPAGLGTSCNPISLKVSKKPGQRLQVAIQGPAAGQEGSPRSFRATLPTILWGMPSVMSLTGETRPLLRGAHPPAHPTHGANPANTGSRLELWGRRGRPPPGHAPLRSSSTTAPPLSREPVR